MDEEDEERGEISWGTEDEEVGGEGSEVRREVEEPLELVRLEMEGMEDGVLECLLLVLVLLLEGQGRGRRRVLLLLLRPPRLLLLLLRLLLLSSSFLSLHDFTMPYLVPFSNV